MPHSGAVCSPSAIAPPRVVTRIDLMKRIQPRRAGRPREVRPWRLALDDVCLVGSIDRSEHVEIEYRIVGGELHERVVSVDVPPWDPEGDGPHSVADKVGMCRDLVGNGAVLLGAFDGEQMLGLAVVDPSFEPRMGWLAFLHV